MTTFKMVGEKIEYVSMDSQTVYQAMADGDIDIVHEVWESTFGASFDKAVATGGVIDLLTHDAMLVKIGGILYILKKFVWIT